MKSRQLFLTLYRAFMRQTRSVDKMPFGLYLLQLPSLQRIQLTHSLPTNEAYAQYLASSLPSNIESVVMNSKTRIFSGKCLRTLIREQFRKEEGNKNSDSSNSRKSNVDIDSAFDALRYLTSQVNVNLKSVQSETNGVRCICTPVFDRITCVPEDNIYPYYYRILFHNMSNTNMQVLARHWIFESKSSKTTVPKFQPGVIGEKPHLIPGATFEYMSSTLLKDSSGTMKGAFLLLNKDNDTTFELDVPLCNLSDNMTY